MAGHCRVCTGKMPPIPTIKHFNTSKGSEYTIYLDGSTRRFKSFQAEHPGDEGLKNRSEKTYYITPGENAQITPAFEELQGSCSKEQSLLQSLRDISIIAMYTGIEEGPNGLIIRYDEHEYIGNKQPIIRKGKRIKELGFSSQSPEKGLVPIEIWEKGRHTGHQITRLFDDPDDPI
jgi:hypothetical protein